MEFESEFPVLYAQYNYDPLKVFKKHKSGLEI